MKLVIPILFSILFFSCNGTKEKTPAKAIWFNSDSTVSGENYHYNDSIDSLVSTSFSSKNTKRKKQISIQKNIGNQIIYRFTVEFDSAGRKKSENYFDMKTSNSISRLFDKSGNIYHETINFFSDNSGGENLMVDYDNKTLSSVFLSGPDFYQKQEYDSLGKIKNLTQPYRVEGATVDSTRLILFITEKQKSEFKDTLFDQVKKLESELQSPAGLK